MKVDTLFCSVPFSDTRYPLMAPAVCKSIALSAGKTSVAIDFNIQLIDTILQHQHSADILTFLKDGVLEPVVETVVFDLFKVMVDDVLKHDPDLVGISVFTYDCMVSAKYLSWLLKQAKPGIKIVLGGAGLFANLVSETTPADTLVQNGVIDYYIRGDGEKPLYNLLKYGSTEEVNQPIFWKQLSNAEIKQLPIPDYSDYDFSLYSDNMLPILGSRGCVRKCTFCDIHAHWTKFTWRTAKDIFNEMVQLGTKHGVWEFRFNDSLVNGNQKEYRELIRMLAEYNATHTDKITWSGMFIFRPVTDMSASDWELTAQSGATILTVGVESLSDTVRADIGKNFNNNDLEYSLQQAKKYGIKLLLLFLVGYVSETENDIINAKQWWRDHIEYRDIIIPNLGTPLGILDNSPIAKDFDKLGLTWVGPGQQDWRNENSDPPTRVRWYNELSQTVAELGYKEYKPFDNKYIMERMITDESSQSC
jgi:radical SAM superfamily enzyme YgiQ (UPF0313 family)